MRFRFYTYEAIAKELLNEFGISDSYINKVTVKKYFKIAIDLAKRRSKAKGKVEG